jgi:L-ascorbate metabolism protein UlaG (beta-lactamase superfamily)
MLFLSFVLIALISSVYLFMHSKPFGSSPTGQRLLRIQQSVNYKNGQFQNLSNTPALTEGANVAAVTWQFLFDQTPHKVPPSVLPSVRTNLFEINPSDNCLVWFGHSSYFMQIDGLRFLVDPVFSGNASPLSFTTRSFKGTDVYKVSDFPAIDYLFITHDHWDHLDYKTILQLIPKTSRVITSLGVGAHLEAWGFSKDQLTEMNWNEKIIPEKGFEVNAVTARHFSGRGFKRNGTVWSSFVLKTPSKNIFIGADSGYDKHFANIGNQFGPFDLAILENGQYNRNWKYIHMMPEETVQASLDLKARKLMPVHWSKFNLSMHAWDEPIIRIKKEANIRKVELVHPLIGQQVNLDKQELFVNWWEEVH